MGFLNAKVTYYYTENDEGERSYWGEGTSGKDYLKVYYYAVPLYGLGGDDRMHGTDHNNVLFGGPGDDWMWGYGGDDRMYGGEGTDVLKGMNGNDKLYGGEDGDYLEGGAGDDELYGEEGDDWFEGAEGNDKIKGGPGNDTMHGWTGNDNMSGGRGDDWFHGGPGNDILKGGAGADTFEFYLGDGADTIKDFSKGDKIHFSAVPGGFDALGIKQKGKHTVIRYGDAGDSITLKGVDKDSVDASDFSWGGSWNASDTFTGSAGEDTFVFKSRGGADTINNFGQEDTIVFCGVEGGFEGLDITQKGDDTVIGYDDHGSTVTLTDVDMGSLSADDFNFIG